jgi:rubrerythrin
MVKYFQKIKEDFVCEACGAEVKGNGYTNHCPVCLVSKHVDIFPGDRLEECQGLMDPVALEAKGDAYRITHRCRTCSYEKINDTQKEDSMDAVYALAKKLADKVSK